MSFNDSSLPYSEQTINHFGVIHNEALVRNNNSEMRWCETSVVRDRKLGFDIGRANLVAKIITIENHIFSYTIIMGAEVLWRKSDVTNIYPIYPA